MNQLFARFPLRVVLIVPFVIIIVAAVGLTGYLSFWNSEKAVNKLASQLHSEAAMRVDEHLDAYLETPLLINNLNLEAARQGNLNLDDQAAVGRYFLAQIQQFQTVASIAYADEQRNYIGPMFHTGDFDLGIAVSSQATGYALEGYEVTPSGERIKLFYSIPDYDPRPRPWYQAAVQAGGPTWTPVFMWSTTAVGLDAVVPVYAPDGRLKGVLDTSLILNGIGQYLQDLNISEHEETFIVDSSGLLVASSTILKPYTQTGETLNRLSALDASDPMTQTAARYVQQHWGGWSAIDTSQPFHFDLAGKAQFAQVTPYHNGGLNWWVVVVIPESDFMRQIENSNRDTAVLIIVSLLAFIGVAAVVARWVTQPILALNRAAKALAQGDWSKKVVVNRRDEVGGLAQSFNEMAAQLQALVVSLRAGEERYRGLFEDSPVSLWEENFSAVKAYLDRLSAESGVADWRAYFAEHPETARRCASLVQVVDVNRATLALLHCDRKERLLADFQQVFADGSYRAFYEGLIALIEGKGVFDTRTVLRTFDGGDIVANLRVHVVPGYEETWWKVLVSLVDVTRHEKAEQALRESEIRFRLLAENSTDMISRHDLKGIYLYVSPACRALLGYDPEDLIGHSSYEFIHPDDRAAVANSHTTILHQPVTSTVEFRARRKDGSYLWLETTSRVIADDLSGQPAVIHAASRDVTDRKQVQAALSESERKYRLLFENMTAGFALHEMIYDAQGQPVDYRFLEVNPAFEKLTGVPVASLVGKTVKEAMPGTEEYWIKVYGRVAQTGEPVAYQNYARELDRYYDVWAFCPAQDRFAVVFTDITERKRAEDALRQRAARLDILHQVDQAILSAALPSDIGCGALQYMQQLVPCQHAAVEIFDFKTQESVVLAADENDDPVSRAGSRHILDAHWMEAFSRGQAYVAADLSAAADLPLFLQELRGQGVHSLAAVPLIVYGELLGSLNMMAHEPGVFSAEHVEIAREVADQLAIAIQQARLYEAERDQRTLAEALRDSMAAVSSTLKYDDVLEQILVNVERVVPHDAANIMLIENGIGRAVRARGWAERGLGEWITTVRIPFGEKPDWIAVTGGKSPRPYTIADVRAASDWGGHPEDAWIRSTAKAPILVGGQVIGVLNLDSATPYFFTQAYLDRLQTFADQAGVAIENARLYEQVQRHAADLERRVAERTTELEAANAELRLLSRMKDEFVSNVSHELRTPITNLKLREYMLGRNPERLQDHLAVIQRETERLAHTIDDLLQLSRIDQERTVFRRVPVNLNTLVGQYVSDRETLANSKPLSLEFSEEPALPDVMSDEGLLGQVLSILLTNALNYTPPAGRVSVRTHSRQEDDQRWAGFSVSDTGPGILPEEQARLFTRFFRGHAGRESGVPGTGLGLAIAREIVARYGGQIAVESEGIAGRGSTFSVWLPAVD